MKSRVVFNLSQLSNLQKGQTQLEQNTKLLAFYSFCRCCSIFFPFFQGRALE